MLENTPMYTEQDVLVLEDVCLGKYPDTSSFWNVVSMNWALRHRKTLHHLTYVGEKEPCLFVDGDTQRMWVVDRQRHLICLGLYCHILPGHTLTALNETKLRSILPK